MEVWEYSFFMKTIISEIKAGPIFQSIGNIENDTEELHSKVFEASGKLLDTSNPTEPDRPGMLLGKIQSGKTAAFIRIVGLSFDNGFDIAIILTKGTVALTDQTVRRLKSKERGFGTAIENDWVDVFDIMQHQGEFTRYELKKKLIIVAKKQRHNLEKITTLLTEKYPGLREKRVLIVDDEADHASVGFRSVKNEAGEKEIDAAKIPKLINQLRESVETAAFLQVTATPYSLYLQPETYELAFVFKPTRPAFTVVLPTYSQYVGSDFYFGVNEDGDANAPYVYSEIDQNELRDMTPIKKTGRADGRSFQLSEVLAIKKIPCLRQALLNFIVGATIRRHQQFQLSEQARKYSFIVHTDTHRSTHEWQKQVVKELVQQLEHLAAENRDTLKALLCRAYEDLSRSIEVMGFTIPPRELITNLAIDAVLEGQLAIDVVNSDNDVKNMLDESGQLRLRAPMNIFIGGQALDRGITIDNLIGFYYGRNPNRFQQDTVLQHSRMYGNRSHGDLSVTRLYTTGKVYNVLRRINDIDEVLRQALIDANGEHGVVFIQKDVAEKIIPCSPNKILLSSTTTLRAGRRLLPVGFDVLPAYKLRSKTIEINNAVKDLPETDLPVLISKEQARAIIISCYASYDPTIENMGTSEDAMLSALDYLSSISDSEREKGMVHLLIRRNRNASREREGGRFFDAPDTQHREGEIVKLYAHNTPLLAIFEQNGEAESGWRAGPFWWPVLFPQQDTKPAIYASETQEY